MLGRRFLVAHLRWNDEWLQVGRVQRCGGSRSVAGQGFVGEAAQQLIRFRLGE